MKRFSWPLQRLLDLAVQKEQILQGQVLKLAREIRSQLRKLADRLGLNIKLDLGAVAESVTVTGEASLLQTESASRSALAIFVEARTAFIPIPVRVARKPRFSRLSDITLRRHRPCLRSDGRTSHRAVWVRTRCSWAA